ncbi:MAG: DUF433 domain-containing protein [Acidobacteriota bacterium]|nr:DUF433 domain-containing protein [Acidobacteriota bacterium]
MAPDAWFESRTEDEKIALRAGALSYPDKKMQRYGHDWREAGAFDWTGCEQVEVVAGKVSGVPLLVHTRMPADSVLSNFEYGMTPEKIAEEYDLDPATVRVVLRFAGVLERERMSA